MQSILSQIKTIIFISAEAWLWNHLAAWSKHKFIQKTERLIKINLMKKHSKKLQRDIFDTSYFSHAGRISTDFTLVASQIISHCTNKLFRTVEGT